MECVAAADTCCRTFYSAWVPWCAALAYTAFDPDLGESFRGSGLRAPEQALGRIKQLLAAERLFDAQPLVPLRHALGAREAAHFQLRHAPAHREVHDRDVLGLARARRDDGAVAELARGVPAGERLGQGADLVGLEQDGVAGAVRG